MSSWCPSLLLGRLAAPPVVITNPDLIKYLIFQLFAEATLVATLVVLSAMALREEWKHAMRLWKRRRGGVEWRKAAAGEADRAGDGIA